MLELAQRLGFDLTDALAGHRELLADFLQRVVRVHADTEPHPQHALFTRGEGRENPRRAVAQIVQNGRIYRLHRILILDEVAEMAVLLVADRRHEGDWLLGDLQYLADPFERPAELDR